MNKGLKALKKASPEAYAKIMGMDKKELGKMADKGLKILKQYFSGGVVPHAAYTPIGMQAQQRAGMQNFVTAAANAEIDRDRKKKKGKKEPMEEMTSMEPEIIVQNVPPKTIMGGGSGMGMKQAEDLMMKDIPSLEAMDGMKVMKDGGMYAEDGKKMPKELLEYFKSKEAEYGMKVMGDGGKYYSHGGSHSGDDEEENISASEALRRMAEANPGRLVFGSTADTARPKGNLLDQSMGFTTAVDNTAVPIQGMIVPPGMKDEPPARTRPGSIDPLQRIGPRVMKREVEKGLVGGPREMPETEKESSFRGIYFAPSTSNIRAFIPTDDGEGSRTFGARGFEMEDRIPYGFRKDGKKIFATPEVFDKMKEEGVGARGALAEDFLMELYDKQPELFSESQSSRGIIQQRVLDEAKRRQPGVGGFYIPTMPLKASFGDGGRMYMQGGKMYGMGGMRPIKNYGHGGKNC